MSSAMRVSIPKLAGFVELRDLGDDSTTSDDRCSQVLWPAESSIAFARLTLDMNILDLAPISLNTPVGMATWPVPAGPSLASSFVRYYYKLIGISKNVQSPSYKTKKEVCKHSDKPWLRIRMAN